MKIRNGVMYVAVESPDCLSLMEWKEQCPSTFNDDVSGEVRCTHQEGHGRVSHARSSYDHGAPAFGLWWTHR